MQRHPVIVSGCDDYFSMGLAAMLKSVSINSKCEYIEAVVLDGGISEESKKKIGNHFLGSNMYIQYLKVDDILFKGFKTTFRIPVVTYYRLLLPSLLPNEIERALYLDSDLIVEFDIDSLFRMDLPESIAAVPDTDKRAHFVSDQGGLKLYKQLGIPATNHYFNAGVMLINLSKWRVQNVSDRVLQYLTDHMEHVLWLDQDGLNAILWNDWRELSPTFNVTTIIYKVSSWQESVFNEPGFMEIYDNPQILHYTHKEKPWHDDCFHPRKDRFWHYMNMLDWQ